MSDEQKTPPWEGALGVESGPDHTDKVSPENERIGNVCDTLEGQAVEQGMKAAIAHWLFEEWRYEHFAVVRTLREERDAAQSSLSSAQQTIKRLQDEIHYLSVGSERKDAVIETARRFVDCAVAALGASLESLEGE